MCHVQFLRSTHNSSEGAGKLSCASSSGSLAGPREGSSREAQHLRGTASEELPPSNANSEPAPLLSGKRVRDIARLRASRANYFPVDLFAEPAWDILLNLYASHLDQRRECIGGIIALSGVPATTGLRWVHKLADEKLILLSDDPFDQRRKWVALSPKAVSGLESFFASARALAC